jgi:hypothetical protein
MTRVGHHPVLLDYAFHVVDLLVAKSINLNFTDGTEYFLLF